RDRDHPLRHHVAGVPLHPATRIRRSGTAAIGDALPPRATYAKQGARRGRNSVVECQLPKLDVAGSTPVARSHRKLSEALPVLLHHGTVALSAWRGVSGEVPRARMVRVATRWRTSWMSTTTWCSSARVTRDRADPPVIRGAHPAARRGRPRSG